MTKYFQFIFLFFVVFLDAATPKLLIKIPTRGRFAEFFNALDLYYKNLSQTIPYQFVITCDRDDPIMNSPAARKKLKKYPNLKVFFSENHSKIEAFNKDIDRYKNFDILIVGSDDMIPQMVNYDLHIVKNMELYFPNYDGVLHYNDGFTKDILITYPILGKKYYDRFGYVFCPQYKAFWCDNELTDVSRMLGKYKYCSEVLFEHQHPANGKGKYDAIYKKNDHYYRIDESLYTARREILFNLSPKLIVNPLQ